MPKTRLSDDRMMDVKEAGRGEQELDVGFVRMSRLMTGFATDVEAMMTTAIEATLNCAKKTESRQAVLLQTRL